MSRRFDLNIPQLLESYAGTPPGYWIALAYDQGDLRLAGIGKEPSTAFKVAKAAGFNPALLISPSSLPHIKKSPAKETRKILAFPERYAGRSG